MTGQTNCINNLTDPIVHLCDNSVQSLGRRSEHAHLVPECSEVDSGAGLVQLEQQLLRTTLTTVDAKFEVEVWGARASGVARPHQELTGDDRLSDTESVQVAAVAVDVAGTVVAVDGEADPAGLIAYAEFPAVVWPVDDACDDAAADCVNG